MGHEQKSAKTFDSYLTVLQNFVLDWKLCLHLCEIYRFQKLVGLESPIKHTLIVIVVALASCVRSSLLNSSITRNS